LGGDDRIPGFVGEFRRVGRLHGGDRVRNPANDSGMCRCESYRLSIVSDRGHRCTGDIATSGSILTLGCGALGFVGTSQRFSSP
jgi:hypothetical protein